ncbi:MAG TPA: ribosome small subunit-dependent GTPase A [Bacteroidales bacterium]|nr:ribosome small subunit-dependent GTPase A [Bacteroidales bacterium]
MDNTAIVSLDDLGYYSEYDRYIKENGFGVFETGRISRHDRELYSVITTRGAFRAEITGNMRYSAEAKSDFPVVGDWVLMIEYDGSYIIREILPRKTLLARKAVDEFGEEQLIASNIDYAFIVQSPDNNFNLNRLERYMAVAYTGGIIPILILNKCDLLEPGLLEDLLSEVNRRIHGLEVLTTSTVSKGGIDPIKRIMQKRRSYCLLGSSGVGKSSLVNKLVEGSNIRTTSISSSTGKGKHTTSHRELFLTDGGSILIDTPGMRELGIGDGDEGLTHTFNQITQIATGCSFDDCTHNDEPGCAVQEAVIKGDIEADLLANYHKLVKESKHYQSTIAEKRKSDREFGKMCRNAMKFRKNNKF